MLKTRLVIAGLFLAILAGLVVAVWVVLPRLATVRERSVMDTPALLVQVQSLSQLTTVKYVMEKIVVLEDPPKTLLAQAFGGDNRVLLVAHGVVKAGVDLQRLRPGDLVISGRAVTVTLPPVEILDVYLDEEKTQVVERTTGLLRSFDTGLEQEARRIAVDDLRRAARQGGILVEAESRAREQLAGFLKQVGFDQVEFQQPP
jgi:hypothetical protein